MSQISTSGGCFLEEGICAMKFIENSHHEEKHELLRSCRLEKNTFKPDNLSKQKVKHALDFFTETTKSLRLRHGDGEKVTHVFLEITNKRVIQPLTTTGSKSDF